MSFAQKFDLALLAATILTIVIALSVGSSFLGGLSLGVCLTRVLQNGFGFGEIFHP